MLDWSRSISPHCIALASCIRKLGFLPRGLLFISLKLMARNPDDPIRLVITTVQAGGPPGYHSTCSLASAPYPAIGANRFLERLLNPLFFWLYFFSIPLRLAHIATLAPQTSNIFERLYLYQYPDFPHASAKFICAFSRLALGFARLTPPPKLLSFLDVPLTSTPLLRVYFILRHLISLFLLFLFRRLSLVVSTTTRLRCWLFVALLHSMLALQHMREDVVHSGQFACLAVTTMPIVLFYLCWAPLTRVQ